MSPLWLISDAFQKKKVSLPAPKLTFCGDAGAAAAELAPRELLSHDHACSADSRRVMIGVGPSPRESALLLGLGAANALLTYAAVRASRHAWNNAYKRL